MEDIKKFKLKSKIWVYPGMAGWHFLTLPKTQAQKITKIFGVLKRGWGSLKVKVNIGKTTWETSIFPDSKTKSYLLPLKAEIRKRENLKAGQTVKFTLEIKT